MLHRKKNLVAPFALGLLFFLACATAAFAQTATPGAEGNQAPQPTPNAPASVTVVGQITNGTPGSTLPVTITVTLYAIDKQSLAFSKEGTADSSGKVQFEDVAYQPGRGYGLVAVVGGVQYSSDLVTPKAGETQLTVPVRIYDTTTDNSRLRISDMYVVGQFLSEKQLQVVNAYFLSNDGDRTVEGGEKNADGKPATLRFYLPAGAENVEFQGDANKFARTADGFVTLVAIPPGTNAAQVVMRYTLPYTSPLHFETKAPYPVQKVQVLMASQGVSLTSPLLTDAGDETAQDGVTRKAYTGSGLAKGQLLAFDLKGTPKIQVPPTPAAQGVSGSGTAAKTAPSAAQIDRRLIGEGIVLAGLLAILVASALRVVSLHRRRTDTIGEHRALYEAIADLDEEHEAGRISDADYAEQREFLKAALRVTLHPPGIDSEAVAAAGPA